tara:strand:- start:185 stop:439 length:255 start_codon:yes stop_codon:yes gene_type:complete
MSDIESMIESLSAEDIKHLMASINNKRVNKVDTSYRLRRNLITDLYYSAEPKPFHLINDRPMTPEEYNEMREGVRQQCITGVDL